MSSDQYRDCCLYGINCAGLGGVASSEAGCDNFFQTYCESGGTYDNKILTDTKCVEWVDGVTGRKSNAADNLMRAACNNPDAIGNNPRCKYWCSRPENAGKCNEGAMAYCNLPENVSDEFCKCINVPTNIKANAKCVWKPCFQSMGAYLTALQVGECPPFIDCTTVLDMRGATNNVINNLRVDQTCIANLQKSTTNTKTQPTPPNINMSGDIKTGGNATTSQFSTNPMLVLLLILGFILIIVVGIIVAIIYRSSTQSKDDV